MLETSEKTEGRYTMSDTYQSTMGSVSSQFRAIAGIKGDPDAGLGLENAKTKAGKGKPVEVAEGEAIHPATPEATQVTETKPAQKKAAVQQKRATAKKTTTAKKTAAKKK
jgi:hypothetical protein